MDRLKQFIKKSFIGGVLVLLPLALLIVFFRWLFRLITDAIQPMTEVLISAWGLPEFLGDILVILLMAVGCFVIGTLVTTGAGRWLHAHFDRYLTRLAPGYKLIKEVVNQFLGDKSSSPFSSGEIAKAYIFGRDLGTSVTAIVTSRHTDGSYTVFVPTGPNPTSGNMYHLPAEQVELFPSAALDEALRTVIACGAGSAKLFGKQNNQNG